MVRSSAFSLPFQVEVGPLVEHADFGEYGSVAEVVA
jgi:hypothetical protein